MPNDIEEALELAREAGGTSHYDGYSFYEFRPDAVEKLVRLAKQRGAEEQKRKAIEEARRYAVYASVDIEEQP